MLKSTLWLGLGGAGCKLVNEALNINPSLNTMFVNNNRNEVSVLNNFEASLDNYLLISGNGSGRDREKARQNIVNNKNLVIDHLSKEVNKYTNFIIIFATGGGFGCGSFKTITKVVYSLAKRYGNEIGITLLPILPKFSNKRIDMQNTLLAYNDIVELKKDRIINNYCFIDNNKIKNINKFNNEVMKTVIEAYSLNNIELDINDARRIHDAYGYKLFLNLEDEFSEDVNDAIEYSISNSNFIIPNSFKNCSHLGISVKEDFDSYSISDLFNVRDFDKADYNDDNNILVVSGCKEPINVIKRYEEYFNKSISEDGIDEEDYIVNIDFKENKTTTRSIKEEIVDKPKKITKADLRKELDDLF